MSLTLFDPFADLTHLRRQINRLLDDSTPAPRTEAPARPWAVPVDLIEEEEAVVVKMDLPGVDQASLDVNLNQDELRISGERPWKAPETGKCVHTERPHGQFYRAFRLGIPVQADTVTASYKEGVLTVRLPKADVAKPRRVEVKSVV